MIKSCDVAVIGAGPAGLSAAIACASRGAEVVCLEQLPAPGGLITNLGLVDDFPWPVPLAGAELIDHLVQRALALGVRMETSAVSGLQPLADGVQVLTARHLLKASAVIAASGARLRKLGISGEDQWLGRGVSQCDWCDGGLCRDQSVAVIGGGDAAFQAALHLARICASVTLVIRGAQVRARRRYVEAAAANERMAFLWETQVLGLCGSDGLEGLRLRNLGDGSESELAVAGVFVFIGTEPNDAYLPPQVQRDANGQVVTDGQYQTSLARVYAVGALRSGPGHSVLGACAQGQDAARAAVSRWTTPA